MPSGESIRTALRQVQQVEPRKLNSILVLSQISPLSVIDKLKTIFDIVDYSPVPTLPGGKAPPDAKLPSDEQYKNASVIWSIFLPPNLTNASQTPNLVLFQGQSAGYGHITDSKYFKSFDDTNKAIFSSASGIHGPVISEHVIATTIYLNHKLNQITYRLQTEKKWSNPLAEFGGLFTRELRTLTVGIVGYGHIGRETARQASALGAKIIALNRSGKPSPEGGFVIPNTGDPDGVLPQKYYSSEDLDSRLAFFADADVVVNTVPSSAENKKFVGVKELTAAKGNSVFVNIGRGDTVDTEALVKALEAKPAEGEAIDGTGTLRIGGTSLDLDFLLQSEGLNQPSHPSVTDPEPLPDGHPLFSLPNAIITPHISGITTEYFVLASDLLAANVARLREGKKAFNVFRGEGDK
ncbi:hypothetical protein T439DRAFT_345513 [Meredithblackwellia eburnea MCA 4105]